MNGQITQGEFEALPFAAGEWETENGWSGEGESVGEFEEERGRAGSMRGGMRGGTRGGMGAATRGGIGGPTRGGMGGATRGGIGRGTRGGGGGRPVTRGAGRPGPVGGSTPGQGRPKPGPRPGRWPRGPYWGPVYGWPGPLMVSEPMGYPLAARGEPEPPAPPIEPIDLPASDDGGGADDGAEQDEMPGALRTVLTSMGRSAPAFRYVGRLDNAHSLGLPRKPGHYLITFRKGNAWRAYNGVTDNLHERLLRHKLGATVLGFAVPNHHVYIAESTLSAQARRNLERDINRAMRTRHKDVLTNQRDELEMELLGWD